MVRDPYSLSAFLCSEAPDKMRLASRARDDHRAERALLRRLCVFASGFVLPAAEAVGEEGKCIDVVDLPDRLMQKSLFDFDAEAEADRCRVR